MWEQIKRNWTVKLIAFGLATLLWLYVNIQASPQLESVYSNIPVELTELPQHLVLIDRPPAVQVRVAGTRTGLASLNQKDIKATVDLSRVNPGNNLVPINVVVPGAIEVISVKPARVNLSAEQILETKWPIVVKVVGSLADGFALLETEVRPAVVTLQGTSQVLNEVKEAFITVKLSADLKEDQLFNLPVEVVNQANLPITSSLRINPNRVEVFLPIKEDIITKIVPVSFSLAGEAKVGFEVAEVTLNPETISIKGPAEVLAEIEEISLGEIQLEEIQERAVLKKPLILPDQVIVIGEEEVEVTIVVEKIE